MLNNKLHLKQLVILSGKGGTGKTSVCASLIHLSSKENHPAVYVDADVDAANLALATEAKKGESFPFSGSQYAMIDPEICGQCGKCKMVCRFSAIDEPNRQHHSYQVNQLLCDGCAACVHICPESAISMHQQQDGEWYHSLTPYGHLFHAELFPGAENSGKLVTTIKQHAKLYAEDHQIPLIIIDGPPGIGCPVISASAGADLALLVSEPGVSGLHDLERIIKTLEHFTIPILICINKANLSPNSTQSIYQLAKDNNLQIAGEIPFDPVMPKAMISAQPITRYDPESLSAIAISSVWRQVQLALLAKV